MRQQHQDAAAATLDLRMRERLWLPAPVWQTPLEKRVGTHGALAHVDVCRTIALHLAARMIGDPIAVVTTSNDARVGYVRRGACRLERHIQSCARTKDTVVSTFLDLNDVPAPYGHAIDFRVRVVSASSLTERWSQVREDSDDLNRWLFEIEKVAEHIKRPDSVEKVNVIEIPPGRYDIRDLKVRGFAKPRWPAVPEPEPETYKGGRRKANRPPSDEPVDHYRGLKMIDFVSASRPGNEADEDFDEGVHVPRLSEDLYK